MSRFLLAVGVVVVPGAFLFAWIMNKDAHTHGEGEG